MTALAGTAGVDARASAAHILVVDDDKRIRALLSQFLASEGYLVSAAADACEAMSRLRHLTFDLIVLDVMMPGESGTQFAARLRREREPLRSAPILMLTALTQTRDRVEGLEAGVDDYLGKPFEPRELSLRIASILRRANRSTKPAAFYESVHFGVFSFHLERGELLERGDVVHLTTRERETLRLLAQTGGDVVSRETLARRAAAAGHGSANERTVDVEIVRLRRKIEDDPGCPRHLQTVRGRGYRLLVDHTHSKEQGNGI